jgi:hypothetical protein
MSPFLSEYIKRSIDTKILELSCRRKDAYLLLPVTSYLTETQHHSIVHKAFCEIRQIKDETERTQKLIMIIPFLKDKLLTEALSIAQALGGVSNRAYAFTALVPFLYDKEKEFAIQGAIRAVNRTRDLERIIDTLDALIDFITDIQYITYLESIISQINETRVTEVRTKCVIRVIPHLNGIEREEFIKNALSGIFACQNRLNRIELISTLVPHLSIYERNSLLEKALKYVNKIRKADEKCKALLLLVPFLSYEKRLESIKLIVQLSKSIKDQGVRKEMYISLNPFMVELEPNILYPLFKYILLDLVNKGRPDFLHGLNSLLDVIIALGGNTALLEMYNSIQDIRQWWP